MLSLRAAPSLALAVAAFAAVPSSGHATDIDVYPPVYAARPVTVAPPVYVPQPVYVAPRVVVAPRPMVAAYPRCVVRSARVWHGDHWSYRRVRRCY